MKIILIFCLITSNFDVLAKQHCEFFSEPEELNKYQQTWSWNKLHLGCADHKLFLDNKLKYEADNLLVIRGHESEINPLYFNTLAQSHGYQLVEKTAAFDPDNPGQTDNHIELLGLNEFRSIQKHPKDSRHLGANLVDGLVDAIDSTRWRDDIVTLSSWSRRTGETGNIFAANWIETQFTELGYQASQQVFQVGSTTTNNIIATKTGSSRPDDWYLVGAHMDSIPTGNAPGAVDNASGCAAVLEMATVASEFDFEGTLIFICFSGEEQGLFGSEFHATGLISDGDAEKIKLALTLDMVGYTSNNDFELLLESSAAYLPIMNEMAQLAATYAPNLTVYTSTNYFGSDHVSYIDNGMPGILSIDDDWNVYPGYHNSNDLPENITPAQGQYILKTNMAMLALKAGVIDNGLIFKNGFQ